MVFERNCNVDIQFMTTTLVFDTFMFYILVDTSMTLSCCKIRLSKIKCFIRIYIELFGNLAQFMCDCCTKTVYDNVNIFNGDQCNLLK